MAIDWHRSQLTGVTNKGLIGIIELFGFFSHSSLIINEMFFLATVDVEKKWTVPRRGWAETISQLAIHFEGRLNLGL